MKSKQLNIHNLSKILLLSVKLIFFSGNCEINLLEPDADLFVNKISHY